mgnify:CR=1 FL=1
MLYMADGSIKSEHGKYLSGELIEKLVTDIVNKFAEAGLSYEEAEIILDRTGNALDEISIVQKNIKNKRKKRKDKKKKR